MENWKDISGYEGLYQISDHGNVRNSEKLMKQISDPNGYLHVNLYRNGKMKSARTHRLVALAFVPNPDNKPCINHIDGNKANNHFLNLEWCTYSENSRHAVNTGLANPTTAKANECCRKPVLMIKSGKVLRKFPSLREAARETGCKSSNLSACCNGGKKPFSVFSGSLQTRRYQTSEHNPRNE